MDDLRATIHRLSLDAVFAALATGLAGLADAEAAARLHRYGPNRISAARRTPLIIKFLANFTHLMALLLWAGGIIGFIARLPQLGIAIWLVNLINGAFSFWQEYRAERATEALRRILPAYAQVVRGGREQRVLAETLVPGDIMLLVEGDHISADGRLLQASALQVDQSTLTGESHPVRKSDEVIYQQGLARSELANLVFAGTSVAAGAGRAVVFATGMESAFGAIARLTQSVGDERSPLQNEMRHVTRIVSAIALAVGAVFFGLAVLIARMDLAESFIFAMGMIVAFVPEGLLPTVTLALAMGVQRMARRNALVKRLSAVETLGCATVICTDKTGTLTQNEMTVCALWLPGGRRLALNGVGYAPVGELREEGTDLTAETQRAQRSENYLASPRPLRRCDEQYGEQPGLPDCAVRRLLTAAALCNDARLLAPAEADGRWSILGDPTEAALLVAAAKAGLDLEDIAARAPRLRDLPFESRRKRMSTLHKDEGTRRQEAAWGLIPSPAVFTVYVKGAPRETLALCTHMARGDTVCPLDEGARAEIGAAIDGYAHGGLRVLAIATRALELPPGQALSALEPDDVERDLTFLGLAAMMDPPRPEVAAAVETCHRAGIRIVMITGDYGLTAESIARRIGIIRGARPRIISGLDLDGMDDAALAAALAEEVIFARVAPEHKLRVVSALQRMGHVVAVTGDGVNDAPALKKADIGVAMGVAGTDVAKESADVILLDDNFASIVSAVEEGRAVYANIKKFITYIFTSNTPEAVPFILYAFSATRIPLALNVMQILAIDLGTDMVPALALGAERPEPGLMERPPRNLRAHVITRGLLARAYFWLGAIQSAAVMAAFYFTYWMSGYWGRWLDLPGEGEIYRAATTMALACVVATQIGNLFAQRTERESALRISPFNNRLIGIGIAVELILVLLIVYVPPLQGVFGTAAFPASYWLFLLAWAPALLLADELRKAMVRRQRAGMKR